MQGGDRVRDSGGKEEFLGEQRYGSRERYTVIVNVVEIRKDMVAKTGREKARRWKARHRGRKEANLAETKADPAARVHGVVV